MIPAPTGGDLISRDAVMVAVMNAYADALANPRTSTCAAIITAINSVPDSVPAPQSVDLRTRSALENLQQSEASYRYAHDHFGEGSREAGRTWDQMRRAGDHARVTLTATQDAFAVSLGAVDKQRCDYDISNDGVMTATDEWQRDDEATMLRLLSCHSIDAPLDVVAGWTDDQVKLADIWAFSSYLSASDHDDIQVPPRPDFIPEATPWPSDRHPITGEPL